MALFQPKPAVQPVERRAVRRIAVDCPAVLRLAGGTRCGRVRDLSETGARFECAAAPAQGASGLLSWDGHEYFGKVVWVSGGACGIVFERPIPQAVVEQTIAAAAPSEVPQGPVARFDNIPLGRKRGRTGFTVVD